MDEKELQSIRAEIDRRRLEIEKEIEEKKKQVEAEIAARRAEMEEKFAQQRLEMERRHREQMQEVHREVNAREVAAKMEAELLQGTEKARVPELPVLEDPVGQGIREAEENHPPFMADSPEAVPSTIEEPELAQENPQVKEGEPPEPEETERIEQEIKDAESEEEQEREIPDEQVDEQVREENGNIEVAKKEKKSRWMGVVAFLIAAALLALGCFYATVFVIKHVFGAVDVGVIYPRTQTVSGTVIEGVVGERFNILVMGTDYGDSEAEKDEPKRTDAMLLLSVDPKSKKIAVLSIPRDTKVILSGHVDPQKINAAYAFGGVVLAKQTVANLLGVPITHYALADWQAFTKVVDLIGGVDILVEHDMKYEDPYADLHIDIKAGYQHLDGKLAGQYVRYRSDELGDIGRTQRQQVFVRAAVQQMCKVGTLLKIPSIVKTISDNVETDLSFMNMVKLFNSVKVFGEKNIRTGTLSGQFQDEDGVSYWQTDEAAIQRILKELDIPSSKIK